ncbi:dual specificity protein phosphatase family protein [Cyberlindnera jadinii NRRL Y-1542]|uniref:protein-tyrosine-phosphatase n=1 Tax=Cyberlindnera jadinii (strain ATCC 18201 / CBS 1600 / BCRC 20928 / JCM 3617 / NBRC 0987 / NRRL Y-1542) TaxID=983966 RepID=A0A1E4RYS4_CYBJN|nr:DSPc-domain-containing protein [Cyberlindnera jadinii NRRL Y-1542]ODV72235.1 DSPc-domain-containing protein [Cyberlindnera jadinii NRRL Y-1542]
MNTQQPSSPFAALSQMSPQSRTRNTKNLSLQLSNNDRAQDGDDTRALPCSSPFQTPQLYRHRSSVSRASSDCSKPSLTRRLTLTIPTTDSSNQPNGNNTLANTNTNSSSTSSSANSMRSGEIKSIPSFTSSSPITSSPIIPQTPDFTATFLNSKESSSQSSSSTLNTVSCNAENGASLRTRTLIHNVSTMDVSNDGDTHKMNAYPDGPVCVLAPHLFLYSEPTLQQVSGFDVVINVARELTPPMLQQHVSSSDMSLKHFTHDSTNYYYVPWTHTSKLCPDLPYLTQLVIDSINANKKILIHCQCGVSRSASLIVACFMKLYNVSLNDAYSMLKERAPDISPNMSLIFQLMEWGDLIGVNKKTPTDNIYTPGLEISMNPLSVEGSNLMCGSSVDVKKY